MMRHSETQRVSHTVADVGAYEPPRVTLIGEDRQVILGVPANGDDYFGYSFPHFEFEPDGKSSTEA
jgi:hypothetical protein